MKARVTAHIDEALDAAKARPDQRQAIAAARDRALATLEDQHRDRRAEMERAIALFEAEKAKRRK